MKPNTMLLNKKVKAGVTTFTVWADRNSQISSFIKKAVSIKNMPEEPLEKEHGVGMGYWVNITIPTTIFEKLISDIKNVFRDDKENILCEDFNQKNWGADMLY